MLAAAQPPLQKIGDYPPDSSWLQPRIGYMNMPDMRGPAAIAAVRAGTNPMTPKSYPEPIHPAAPADLVYHFQDSNTHEE
jgi:hypothetical protein